MTSNRFTSLVGCRHPLQLAGMGLVGSPDLAAAVSNAGALGMLGPQPGLPAEVLEAVLGALGSATGGNPFGANFIVPFIDDPALVEVAGRHARVVEFHFGDPDPDLASRAKAAGALVSWQVGSGEEARAAVQAGADVVVAQGTEAGGHVRATRPLAEVLAGVIEAVDVPVVAAGGIATGERVAAVLSWGADAVRVGTRFLAAEEADVHPDYVRALLDARGEDTVLTETFSADWPHAPHRVLRSAVERAQSVESDVIGELRAGDAVIPILRLSSLPPTRSVTGDVAAMALYAGEGVGDVQRVQPAAEIVRDLMEESLR